MRLGVKSMVQPCLMPVAHYPGGFPSGRKSDCFQFDILLISGTLLFSSLCAQIETENFYSEWLQNIKSVSAEAIQLEMFHMVYEDAGL